MHTHETATQSTEKVSATASYATGQSGGSASFAFNDQRPETVAQLKLQEMADQFTGQATADGPVVQRVELVPQSSRRAKNKMPKIITSAGFDANHVAADNVVDEAVAKTRRAARPSKKNTIVKLSALQREATTNRQNLISRVMPTIPGAPTTTEFNLSAGEAKTATFTGVGSKADVENATVAAVSRISVMSRTVDDKTVEIHHLESAVHEAPPAAVVAPAPVVATPDGAAS